MGGGKIAVRERKKVAKKALSKKEELLRNYELVLIISPETEGEEFDAVLDNLKSAIKGQGGTVDETVVWGKRKLAYPINHALEGNYALVHFKAKPSANKELEGGLRISEKILRHLLVNLDDA